MVTHTLASGTSHADHRAGPVFRVSPNELSFGSASSFKTIYGTPAAGRPRIPKNEFYDMFGSGFSEPCLASEKDPRTAGKKRGLFSATFSSKALGEQEAILQQNINAFVEKLGLLSKDSKGLDMVKWYEMVSFDILGEMAFGESFKCIEKGSPSQCVFVEKHRLIGLFRASSLLAGSHPRAHACHYLHGQYSSFSSPLDS